MQQQRMRRKIPKKNPQHSTDSYEQQIFAGNFTIEIRGLKNSLDYSSYVPQQLEAGREREGVGDGPGIVFSFMGQNTKSLFCGPLLQYWALFDGPNIIGL